MKHALALVATIASTILGFTSIRAAEVKPSDSLLAAVRAADDARVAAMKSPKLETLNEAFSSELHYAHSNGEVDTKSSFIEKLTTGKTKYLTVDYEKRDFSFPAPGLALMTGRVKIRAASAASTMDSTLSFLAVWRLENGHWRFLAWQSCRLPAK